MIGAKFVKRRLIVLLVLTALVSGCTAGRAFRKGRESARTGDWDTAVMHYTEALQASPDNAEYKIELERATQNAARDHITRARELEQKDQLDAALIEYKKAVEIGSRPTGSPRRKAAELERTIRDRIEQVAAAAADRAPAAAGARPGRSRFSTRPIARRSRSTSTTRACATSSTSSARRPASTFSSTARTSTRPYTVNLDGITLEEALQQILSVNGFFYKVLNPTTIVIAPDTPAGHQKYDDLVMQVFYLSHADVQEVSQTLNAMMRIQAQVAPAIYPNKTSNTIAVRATAAIVAVAERLIRALDRPRAEVVIEVQILEVNRNRAKQFGINLSDYALGLTFSPEAAPPNTSGTIPPTAPPPFNLNTISQGISTVRLLPHGADGVPAFPGDGFAHEAAGQAAAARRGRAGADAQPRRSDSGRVDRVRRGRGRRLRQHPAVVVHLPGRRRQHHDDAAGDLRGRDHPRPHASRAATSAANISVAGQDVPSFGSRRVKTRLRLREGESNLLAGLLEGRSAEDHVRHSPASCACPACARSSARPTTRSARPTSSCC